MIKAPGGLKDAADSILVALICGSLAVIWVREYLGTRFDWLTSVAILVSVAVLVSALVAGLVWLLIAQRSADGIFLDPRARLILFAMCSAVVMFAGYPAVYGISERVVSIVTPCEPRAILPSPSPASVGLQQIIDYQSLHIAKLQALLELADFADKIRAKTDNSPFGYFPTASETSKSEYLTGTSQLLDKIEQVIKAQNEGTLQVQKADLERQLKMVQDFSNQDFEILPEDTRKAFLRAFWAILPVAPEVAKALGISLFGEERREIISTVSDTISSGQLPDEKSLERLLVSSTEQVSVVASLKTMANNLSSQRKLSTASREQFVQSLDRIGGSVQSLRDEYSRLLEAASMSACDVNKLRTIKPGFASADERSRVLELAESDKARKCLEQLPPR